MTDAQKLLISSLVVTGLVLAYNLLDWTSQFGHDDWTPIVIFYGAYDPLGYIAYWGLHSVWRRRRHPRRGCAAVSFYCGGIHRVLAKPKGRASIAVSDDRQAFVNGASGCRLGGSFLHATCRATRRSAACARRIIPAADVPGVGARAEPGLLSDGSTPKGS